MKEIVKKYLKEIKDYIFPIFCLGCDQEGEWLCQSCMDKLDFGGVWSCPVCHHYTGDGRRCVNCLKKLYLSREVAIVLYQEESLVGNLITVFKYQFASDAKSAFAELVNRFWFNNADKLSGFDLIVPVPLHRRRLAERGFNQAQIISIILSAKLKVGVDEVLVRSRATRQQAKLSKVERQENVRDAFLLKKDSTVAGKKILLVDDVFTTGSTMQECAKVLLLSGAEEVSGFTLARG